MTKCKHCGTNIKGLRYYVYTLVDGNEDGKFLGLSLADAKTLAERHSNELSSLGESDTRAYVLELETSNFVCGFGDKS